MRKRKDRAAEIAARLPPPVVKLADGGTFYTIQGLANLLGVQRITIWRWLKARRLTGARVGRQVYIQEATVREFLEHGGVKGKRRAATDTGQRRAK